MNNLVFSLYDYYSPEENIPFFTIDPRPTDKKITYIEGEHTMDMLSYKYYRTSLYGWIILNANGFVEEFDIQDGTTIRIPSPIDDVIQEITQKIKIDKGF